MRLLVQNFLNVLVVSQARRLMVVEALAVEDFAVLVLEREVQKHVVDRPVADVGDLAETSRLGGMQHECIITSRVTTTCSWSLGTTWVFG